MYEAATPKITPKRPPVMLISVASIRNWARMSRPLAPMLILRPISLVRSVTETYMMFMIPMPPTRRDIPATAASRVDIMSLVLVIIEESSCCERMLKSSSSDSFSLWLRRRTDDTSSMALSVYSSLSAEQTISWR